METDKDVCFGLSFVYMAVERTSLIEFRIDDVQASQILRICYFLQFSIIVNGIFWVFGLSHHLFQTDKDLISYWALIGCH